VLGIMPVKLINHVRFSVRKHMMKSCLAGFRLFFSRALDVWSSREAVRTATFLEFIRRSHETR
jgi:hypothetical protein